MRRGLTVRMIVADAVLVTVVGTTFAFLLLAIAQPRESARLSHHASDQLIAAGAIEKVVIDLETGVRGYVITGKEQFLEPFNNARADFPAQARTLERLARNNPDELRRTRQIEHDITLYIQHYADRRSRGRGPTADRARPARRDPAAAGLAGPQASARPVRRAAERP
jgi:CHASE3 domain sensor protein